MTVPIRRLICAPLLALCACVTSAVQPAPTPSTPQHLYDRVAAFAQPSQEDRLFTLKSQLDEAGLAYDVETFDGDRSSQAAGYNVIVRTGPPTGQEILLVAHYDAVVLANGRLADGLIDNAASVVAMIEATRRLAGRTTHPVRLLLTDQEELGLVGAEAWIDAHGVENIAAVINADVSGNGDTLMYGLNGGVQSGFLTTAAAELCTARALSCLAFPQYPPSDDRAFSAAGAPTLSLGYQPRAEAEKLRAFLLNQAASAPDPATVPEVLMVIHTANDTLAKVQADTLAQAADFITALVIKLDAELS
jgi:Zn-dependent M28 family amino/carboxypeptidase